jgi:serine/threonine protein kinase
MPKYEKCLDVILKENKQHLSKQDVCSLIVSLLKTLKMIHAAGFIYGDLKLDNIMTSG